MTTHQTTIHEEGCGCRYEVINVPDDQWIGQGWRKISGCLMHATRCAVCGGLNPGDGTHIRCVTNGYEGL